MLAGRPLVLLLLWAVAEAEGRAGIMFSGNLANLPPPVAKLKRVLPFPFEEVHKEWEAGEPDEKFIREEKEVTWSGAEMCERKLMYTKNPFPFIVRKTVVRSPELVWYEELRLNRKKRYATFWSTNMSLQGVGRAYRKATMCADPDNPNYTLFEQVGGCELLGDFPKKFKKSVCHFAANAFLSICRRAADSLHVSLAKSSGVACDLVRAAGDEGGGFVLRRRLRELVGSALWFVTQPSTLLASALLLTHVKAAGQELPAVEPTAHTHRAPAARARAGDKRRESAFKLSKIVGAVAAFVAGMRPPMLFLGGTLAAST